MEELENKEYCKNCGGYCCKKSGCDYSVKDFPNLSLKGLIEILDKGNISIVCYIKFIQLKNNKLIAEPFLYLRARNKNREIIDLLSIKNTCSMLTADGCTYDLEHRPSGGVNLIPAKNRYNCHPKNDPLELLKTWESYQNLLRKIVKRYTGMTVEEKLKQDTEKLFYNVLLENFEDAAIEEVIDIKGMIPHLAQAYPEELEKAIKRIKQNFPVKILNKKPIEQIH